MATSNTATARKPAPGRNLNTSQNNNPQNQGSNGQPRSYLQKFFVEQLKDIYYAEKELLKALPEMKQATTTEELEDAFDTHIRQTERQMKRLEKVFRIIGEKPEGKKCEAMDSLIKEGKTIIAETEEGTMTRDAALIIAAQKIEHYEIATYGGLVELAATMGMAQAGELLDKTLREEEETDLLLTDIAESYINVEAEHEGEYSWEKDTNNLAGRVA